jgi:hypothetical protein
MEHDSDRRPHPKEAGWSQQRYLAFAKPKDIAADLAEAADRLSEWDRHAALSMVCQYESNKRLSVNQLAFATSLIWRAWKQDTMQRCPCCDGRC